MYIIILMVSTDGTHCILLLNFEQKVYKCAKLYMFIIWVKIINLV